jgi:hypothetical protein
MGINGTFGFLYKGKYYLFYNHWDSYLTGLGQNLIDEIRTVISKGNLDGWKDKLLTLKPYSKTDIPTKEDIEKLSKYTDLRCSTQSTSDWYCLLRNCQGSYEKVLESGYYDISCSSKKNLCENEFTYLLNFDTNKFECYCEHENIGNYTLDNLPDFSEEE